MPDDYKPDHTDPGIRRTLRYAEKRLSGNANIRTRADITKELDNANGIRRIGGNRGELFYDALNGWTREQWNSVFRWIKDVG